MINFREHVLDEFRAVNADSYLAQGGMLNDLAWRKLKPNKLFDLINKLVQKRYLSA
jgi:hypothetical protein